MAIANSKIQDAQTLQERARRATEGYPTSSNEKIPVRKVQHLDVDRVLSRSFKNVKPISLAVDQPSFEQ